MKLRDTFKYEPSFLFRNPHLNTMYPAVFRQIRIPWHRERIVTKDDDFLDLDFYLQDKVINAPLAILCHGLEGNSRQSYMSGMAKILHQLGYQILSWNYRSCSDELNRKPHFYHSGFTQDLAEVLEFGLNRMSPQFVTLIGFSLGGNLVLKFLGEPANAELKPSIKNAIAVSTPCNLHHCTAALNQPQNLIYTRRFLTTLKKKVLQKSKVMDLNLDLTAVAKAKTLEDFDDAVTAPSFGYKNAIDYWQQNSCFHFLENINTPTLLINAKDDPFLQKDCYPNVRNLMLRCHYPQYGGHVGFYVNNDKNIYAHEAWAMEFLSE